jgi:glucuronate isomerase
MEQLTERLFAEIAKIRLIDPHTHIDPRQPTARDLDDLLGYHYYTELAHSTGMGTDSIRSEIPSEERAKTISAYLPHIDNTAQFGWFLEMAQTLFSFPGSDFHPSKMDELWSLAERTLNREDWESELFGRTCLEQVFLTNEFDDPLEGFDTTRYVPCLRTDDLVFCLGNPAVAERLRQSSGKDIGNAPTLRDALGTVFERFAQRGARACAISLPPDFTPEPVDERSVDPPLRCLLSGDEVVAEENQYISQFVFWSLAELCRDFKLPFDLMIGVHRNVYPGGVHQGRDLFNRLVSLHQYRHLFNAFPTVTFPVSVLASDTNQELVAYTWIFPNVVSMGHWWYSNVPAYIEPDARARLQAVPRTKQVGYYSDAYKLEFILPKFNMYRRVLARILAEDFVLERRWSEERAVGLARDLLRGNVERIFFPHLR